MRASEAKKASYFLASFLTSFLFLLSLRSHMRERHSTGRMKGVSSLLQVIHRLVLEVNLLSTVDVGGIGENADRHARTGDMGKPEHSMKCW